MGYSYTFLEQAWIPAGAANIDAAKQFMAFMYSDTAAEIFAESGAIQPISGMDQKLEGDNALFYSVYENGAKPAMGGWAATAPVEGVSIMETMMGGLNGLISGTTTQEQWAASIVEVMDTLRANKV